MVAPLIIAAATTLLPLVLKLAPELARWAGGPKAGDIAVKGAEIIEMITGTTDPDQAEEILKDPTKTIEARIALAKIAADQAAAEQQAKLDTLRAELSDVQNARSQTVLLAQADSKIAWAAPIISVVIVAGFFFVPAGYAWGGVEPDQIWLGALIAGFGAVYQYWLGASRSGQQAQQAVERVARQSADVSRDTIEAARKAAEIAAEKAATAAALEAARATKPPPVVVVPQPPAPAPVAPPADVPAVSEWKQGPYGGARWKLIREGVLVEGDPGVARTVGTPITVRRAWTLYGPLVMAECAKRGVPVEVAMAILCTESGSNLNPAATLVEPDKRTSSGIMQVLTGTASEMLGRSVTVADLQRPEVSIEAGVAYIAYQKSKTWFDPILAAAAYNAGGIYEPRPQDDNRFRLRSTGDHLERMIRWYGDVCFVSQEDNWFKL